jgi:polyhydroxybutyrate depolymerase
VAGTLDRRIAPDFALDLLRIRQALPAPLPPALLLLALWLLAALAGCGAASGSRSGADAGRLEPGDHRIEIAAGGRQRSYLVHLPPQAAAGTPLPLLLNFHGAASNAAGQQRFSRLNDLADRAGFLVVYPDGTGRFKRFLTWNAGTCCGSAMLQRVDDVGFTVAVLDDCARRMAVDRRRVYATGMSNGAMMAHRLAAEVPERIAAIAPVAGGMVYQRFRPGLTVPVLQIHSVDDPRALYHGGLGPAFPGTDDRVLHPDVEEMMRRWADHDGCTAAPRVVATLHSPDGQTSTHLVWSSCRDGAEVALWRLTGAGHVWPGVPAHRPRLLGTDTTILDADQAIWDFVSRFHR